MNKPATLLSDLSDAPFELNLMDHQIHYGDQLSTWFLMLILRSISWISQTKICLFYNLTIDNDALLDSLHFHKEGAQKLITGVIP